MMANRTDDGTPLDNTNGGDNDENGANRALLTQDEDERAPEVRNIDEDNANDDQAPLRRGLEMELNLRCGMASGLVLKDV